MVLDSQMPVMKNYKILIKINFICLHNDPYFYKRINNRNTITCLLAIYVDDI